MVGRRLGARRSVRRAADFADSKAEGSNHQQQRERIALDCQEDTPGEREGHEEPDEGCEPKFFHKARDGSRFWRRGKRSRQKSERRSVIGRQWGQVARVLFNLTDRLRRRMEYPLA